MLYNQWVLTVPEFVAEGIKITGIMGKRGHHGCSLYGFPHIQT
jgi:hypothetical protein